MRPMARNAGQRLVLQEKNVKEEFRLDLIGQTLDGGRGHRQVFQDPDGRIGAGDGFAGRIAAVRCIVRDTAAVWRAARYRPVDGQRALIKGCSTKQ